MNIAMTIILGGTFAALSGGSAPQASDLAPLNPFAGLGVSAAGVSLELTGDGLETRPSNTTDFVIELKLKSGTPIRVRL